MNTEINKAGLLFIISAPSGAGKTSLVRSLINSDHELVMSVSYTTRPRRADETEGVSYYFIDDDTFQHMANNDEFLEFADVFDYRYGTGKSWVEDALTKGIDIILEIDWQGAQQIRQRLDETVSLFILPPSLQALEDRLKNRGEKEETVKRRMRDAVTELSHYQEFDYFVVNDDFNRAIDDLRTIINAKRQKSPLEPKKIDNFAMQLMEQAENIQ